MIVVNFKLVRYILVDRQSNNTMVEPVAKLGVKRPPPRSFLPQEMQHRFGAKSDFVRYFKEQCKWFSHDHLIVCSVAVRPAGGHAEQGLPATDLG